MKKVLVIGSNGMAGHIITLYLEQNIELDIYNLSHSRKLNDKSVMLDVTNFYKFEKLLDNLKPDYIVNCIGILNRYAEIHKDMAILLNSYLPRFLEYKYKNDKTKIIHISTDCVFSGKDGNYHEDSFKDGDTFYARTKALGEIINEKDLTFRTSIIGPDLSEKGIGLFNWFMKSSGTINGYVNSIWTGVTTLELAKAIETVINTEDITGLYHLVPDKCINKYDLLNILKFKFNRNDIIINRYENKPVKKNLIDMKKAFSYVVPEYDSMIDEMKEWINNHKYLYKHYYCRKT